MNQITKSEEEILTVIYYNCMQNKMQVEKDWELFLQLLSQYEIGMEETLHFLHRSRPALNKFFDWIYKHIKVLENKSDTPIVLSETEMMFWKKNGYIVLKNAVSPEDCLATRDAIAEFLQIDLSKPESWYVDHDAKEGLMVLFTQHPTLKKNRGSLKIKKAFEQLYGHDQLYKTIDKVSFNPPETNHFKFNGSPLHWDVSLHLPIPYRLQGLLYLTDVPAHGGAFHCIPGFQDQIGSWLQSLPSNTDPFLAVQEETDPVPVPGNAGDFIIWHQALPHGATPNRHYLPRMVQYLTYLPKTVTKS